MVVRFRISLKDKKITKTFNTMKKRITSTTAERMKLMKVFGCTDRMVHKALAYDSDSDLAKRIRRAALKQGCQQIVELLEIETFHDADHYMRQYLPNGAMLEMSKERGTCDVIFKGNTVRHYDKVMVSEINNIQAYAGALR
jgi:hypothetical protein